ncbi:MAG: TonB-dependent receptor, partial [Treponema sp.]|nr:TonB-dependent receptor [Treponema sp.]
IHWYSKNNSVWRPENVGEAFFWGLENKFQWEIPLGKRPFTQIVPALSYQYIASYLLSYGYAFADRQRVPYCPEHTIGMSLGLHWKTGLLLIWGNFESLKYHDTLNHTVLSGRFLANVSVNQDIGKRFTVFAALKNILNSSYESFYDYPMPGITLDIGLRIKLEAKNE